MSVRIRIPTPLRRFTADLDVVAVEANSVRGAIDALETKHPGIKARLCDEQGALRRFVNVYYKDEDVRFLSGLDTAVADGTELSIVPAIAGG
ncbi:MAG: MoaD/ThiS family protein [Myxococcota bacterium]